MIAVTGSCGKTSATTFLSRILSADANCHAGIFENNENSVIRTLRRCSSACRYYVQETSGHKPGALARVLPMIRHDIGVVTAVGLDHYTNFRTLEAVAREKVAMVSMLPESGTAILNADDPWVIKMASQTSAKVMTYGRAEGADVRATDVRSSWPDRLSLTVHHHNESVHIQTNLFGELLLPSLLAAVGAALAAGVSLTRCGELLHGMQAEKNRTSIHQSPTGIWFIDDTYKAPYWTIQPTIDQMRKASAPRKTIIFGSFSDCGSKKSKAIRRAAMWALEGADRVIMVGKSALALRSPKAQKIAGRLFDFDQVEDAAQFLREDAMKNELILIKSNGADGLDRLIDDGQANSE